jgi:hypothetical protein
MAWQERLIEARVTTPDLEEYLFQYTDVSKETSMKTSTYEFSETPGALVQSFGNGALSIPLTLHIAGQDYDLDAKDLEDSLALPGVSVLEHPIYGILNVTPVSIRRSDRLRSGGGEAIFDVVFVETIIPVAPGEEQQTVVQIEEIQTELAEINIGAFLAAYLAVLDAIDAAARAIAFVNDMRDAFNEVLSTVASIQAAFNEAANFITSNIDFLLSFPDLLASSLQRLISSPAKLITSVKKRIDLFKGIQEKILTPPTGANTQDTKNQLLEKQLISTSILSAMATVNLTPNPVATNTGDVGGVGGTGATGIVGVDPLGEETSGVEGFLTKQDAIDSVIDLTEQYEIMQIYLDEQQAASLTDDLDLRFSVNDTVIQKIKQIISLTTANLIRLSFDLKQERIITLLKPRTILDLCYEFYGTTEDSKLNFFINSNVLTGEELLLVPAGREIRYYV